MAMPTGKIIAVQTEISFIHNGFQRTENK